jgi:hypothetical protein
MENINSILLVAQVLLSISLIVLIIVDLVDRVDPDAAW